MGVGGYATSGFCFKNMFQQHGKISRWQSARSPWFPASAPCRDFPGYFQKEKSEFAGIWMRQHTHTCDAMRVCAKLHLSRDLYP